MLATTARAEGALSGACRGTIGTRQARECENRHEAGSGARRCSPMCPASDPWGPRFPGQFRRTCLLMCGEQTCRRVRPTGASPADWGLPSDWDRSTTRRNLSSQKPARRRVQRLGDGRTLRAVVAAESCASSCPSKGKTRSGGPTPRSGGLVEVGGVEPPSENLSVKASTCVAGHFGLVAEWPCRRDSRRPARWFSSGRPRAGIGKPSLPL